jgi:hypothetical protein
MGDGPQGGDDVAATTVWKPPSDDEIATGAGGGVWDEAVWGEAGADGEEATAAQPARAGGDAADEDDDSPAADEMLAQPTFLKPAGLGSAEDASPGALGVDLAILTPAAAAILRSSFSSRLRSFSLRLSCSSGVFCLARCVFCISRKRILWWCAYELVCSSYCATFWNCLSQTVQ